MVQDVLYQTRMPTVMRNGDVVYQTPDGGLGRAVGIVMSTYVRHEQTDYDSLMRTHKLMRDEARQVVKAEHDELLKVWSKAKDAEI